RTRVAGRSRTPAQLHGAHHGALHARRSIQPAGDGDGGRPQVLYETVCVHARELLLDEGAGFFREPLCPVRGDRVSRHARQAVRNKYQVVPGVRRYLSAAANIFAARYTGATSGDERYARSARPASAFFVVVEIKPVTSIGGAASGDNAPTMSSPGF